MIGSRTVLLLLGTTIAYCHVLRNGELCEDGETHPVPVNSIITIDGHGLKDLTSVQPMVLTSARVPHPFIQQGTNLFYKPQFMMPGHFIPTAISNIFDKKKETPPKPEILFPEQPYISQVPEVMISNAMENSETKPVKIPQGPEIPLFTNEVFEVQSAARPIIVEPAESLRSMDLPQPPELPSSFSDVLSPVVVEVVPPHTSESPSFPMTIKSAPIVLGDIPESPVLPPFTMPALPVLSKIPSEPGKNLIEIPEPPMLHPTVNPAIIDVEGESLSDFKPIKIPEAPTLPPFTKVELPVHVTVPAAPEFPTFVDINPAVDSKPLELPEPPVVSPFIMPEQSVKAVIPPAPEIPPFVGIDSVPELKAIEISQPVILPPLPMPELPVHAMVPATPEIQLNPEIKPVNIPEPPVLPFFIKPQLPSPVFTPLNSEGPASIALVQSIPETPTLAPMVSVSCFPESYEIASVSELKPIPPPPELTPIQISTIPALLDETFKQEHVVIPEAPELPPISNSVMPEVIEYKPIHIPQAPELSIFTLPELPTISIIPEKPYQEISTPPKEIPAPPVLPPFVIESIPIFAETPEQAPDFKPIDIPSAPELPSLTMPTIPVPLVIGEHNKELCDKDTSSEKVAPTVIMPEVPLVASGYSQLTQPTFWAQNIIIERVLPHIFVSEKDHMKILEVGRSDPVNTIPYFISSSH